MIPIRPPTLVFVAALHPFASRNYLPANAFLLLFLIFNSSLRNFVPSVLHFLPHFEVSVVVLVEIVESISLEVEGVEEGSFSEGFDLCGVDSSDGDGGVPFVNDFRFINLLYNFFVFGFDELG